ncbi:MAG: glycosyltransferase family 39 protein [Saprospiraceae bacterium]
MAKPVNRPVAKKATAPKPDFTSKKSKMSETLLLEPGLSKRALMILLITFTCLAFLLRIPHLDGVSLWVDEFVHVIRAKNFAAGNGPLFDADNNGILYTMLMIPFYKLFGSTAFWGRLPAVLCGTACIPLVFYLGRRMFNNWTGLIAAFLTACSLYCINWSRLARNYSIFECFFLLLLLCFLLAFDNPRQEASNKLKSWGINPRYLLILPFALILALISHQLSFFFVFIAGFYFAFNGIAEGIIEKRWNTLFIWLGLPFLLVIFFLFTPSSAALIKTAIAPFVEARNLNWFMPDWTRLGTLWKNPEKKFEAWTIYKDVMTYDFKGLTIIAIIGFILAFRVNRRSAILLIAGLAIPVLLMSFVFREPSLPRYLIYIYPLFLIAVAIGIQQILAILARYVFKTQTRGGVMALYILPFILLLTTFRYTEIKDLLMVKQKSGFIVDKKLSQWSFTNWKDPVEWVKNTIKAGDVVISTVPIATSYYVGLSPDSVAWFRQRQYDGTKKEYVPFTFKGDGHNANTLEDLKLTMEKNARGWLIADYYLYNVMTDPRARDFVFSNMHFHPEACKDGSVQVFSWDKAEGPPQNQNTILEIGKVEARSASDELTFNVNQDFLRPGLKIALRAADINYNNEAYVIINKTYTIPITANVGNGIEDIQVPLDISKLKMGANTIQFAYNPDLKYDPAKGFVIYNVQFGF